MAVKRSKNRRQAELAKIHIARRDLGMDEETYRMMLENVAGVRSAADLDAAGRRAVLDHLQSIGFVPAWPGSAGRNSRPEKDKAPANMSGKTSRARQLRKIGALLAAGKRPWSYADALAKRICGIDRIVWVPADQLYKVITALRKQGIREGWDLSGEHAAGP